MTILCGSAHIALSYSFILLYSLVHLPDIHNSQWNNTYIWHFLLCLETGFEAIKDSYSFWNHIICANVYSTFYAHQV